MKFTDIGITERFLWWGIVWIRTGVGSAMAIMAETADDEMAVTSGQIYPIDLDTEVRV